MRLYKVIALLFLALFLLAACAPKATPGPPVAPKAEAPTAAPKPPTPPPTQAPAAKGKITLWHAWKEAEITALNEVIKAFQAKYPDVAVEVLYVPFDDLRGKYETAAATGSGPTVLIGASDWGPALYDAKLVANVADVLSDALKGTISPAALGAVQYKGAVIGLPQTVKGVVMFRNKTIVAQPYAKFEDMISGAASGAGVDTANLERGFFFSAAHLNGIGGALMAENGDPAFNNDKGVEWVKLLNDFSKAGPAEYYTDNDVNAFKAGKVGVIIDGSWNATALAEAIGKDNLVVDPWPTYGSGHLSGYVQTENIYLNADVAGDDKTAGWKFIEFFLSPEAQAMLLKAGHLPAVSGVKVEDPLLAQMVKAFEQGTAFPVIPEMGAYWESMDNALKSVFDEGADPAAALAKAEESIKAKIAEIRK